MAPASYLIRLQRGAGSARRVVKRTFIVSASQPPQPTPLPGSSKVIGIEDLVYDGTTILPRDVEGGSTGYATGLLGIRRVQGTLHGFSDAHIYSHGELYEFRADSFSTKAPYPDVELVKYWGSIYGDKRVDGALETYPDGVTVNGLLWDETLGGLWWAYGEPYNTVNKDAPSVGFSRISSDGKASPSNALRLHSSPYPNLWTRGCVIQVPPRLTPSFGGRRLAAGCGGYYSIIAGGSWGPALTVFDPASPSTRRVVLGYPDAEGIRAPRPGDYYLAESAGSGNGWMGRNPGGSTQGVSTSQATGGGGNSALGNGTWTGSDEIGGESYAGSAVWVDTPNVGGLLMWASQGTGRIGYDAGAITSSGRANRLYTYRSQDIQKVFTGAAKLSVAPASVSEWKAPSGFLSGRVAGVAIDPGDPAVFYVVQVQAYQMGSELFPVLHRYRIRQ